MTWLLIIIGIAIGDGPDMMFAEPMEEIVDGPEECVELVERLTMDAIKDIGDDLTVIYSCIPRNQRGES